MYHMANLNLSSAHQSELAHLNGYLAIPMIGFYVCKWIEKIEIEHIKVLTISHESTEDRLSGEFGMESAVVGISGGRLTVQWLLSTGQ